VWSPEFHRAHTGSRGVDVGSRVFTGVEVGVLACASCVVDRTLGPVSSRVHAPAEAGARSLTFWVDVNLENLKSRRRRPWSPPRPVHRHPPKAQRTTREQRATCQIRKTAVACPPPSNRERSAEEGTLSPPTKPQTPAPYHMVPWRVDRGKTEGPRLPGASALQHELHNELHQPTRLAHNLRTTARGPLTSSTSSRPASKPAGCVAFRAPPPPSTAVRPCGRSPLNADHLAPACLWRSRRPAPAGFGARAPVVESGRASWLGSRWASSVA
jgi:hypothetical protein